MTQKEQNQNGMPTMDDMSMCVGQVVIKNYITEQALVKKINDQNQMIVNQNEQMIKLQGEMKKLKDKDGQGEKIDNKKATSEPDNKK